MPLAFRILDLAARLLFALGVGCLLLAAIFPGDPEFRGRCTPPAKWLAISRVPDGRQDRATGRGSGSARRPARSSPPAASSPRPPSASRSARRCRWSTGPQAHRGARRAVHRQLVRRQHRRRHRPGRHGRRVPGAALDPPRACEDAGQCRDEHALRPGLLPAFLFRSAHRGDLARRNARPRAADRAPTPTTSGCRCGACSTPAAASVCCARR